ncbi:MAG: hypothetical protein R2745_11225 [Vicinamibacterales bacterium]
MSVQRGPDRMGRFTARVGRTGRAQLLLVALAASASIGVHGQPSAWRPVPLRPPDEPSLPLVCEPPDATGRIRTAAAAAAGTALSYWQDPPWLMARDDQGLRLRRFVVAGDVDRVRFDRWDVDTQDYVEETWTRDRSDTIGGRLVSIFEPSWPADVIQRRLELALVGLDRPSFWLGVYRGPVDGPAASSSVNVRVGSQAMGTTEVVRIDDTAQYASHVVNLVIPDFGDDRVGGAFDLRPVARAFYDYFADDYDVLAIVPYDGQIDSATAFHQRVRNDVSGIGLSIFDRSADYGSGGRLRGVELFHQTGFGWNDVSTHELTHAWGHDFDWTRIAGIARAGHQPTSHAPLMTGGETQLGAVLEPTRRAVIKDDDSAVIERVRGPARQHPLDLYAMGLADVPELGTFTLFEDQAQFDASSSSTPAPGTAVAGGRKTVSVNDLLGAYGSRRVRSRPTSRAPRSWSRAAASSPRVSSRCGTCWPRARRMPRAPAPWTTTGRARSWRPRTAGSTCARAFSRATPAPSRVRRTRSRREQAPATAARSSSRRRRPRASAPASGSRWPAASGRRTGRTTRGS